MRNARAPYETEQRALLNCCLKPMIDHSDDLTCKELVEIVTDYLEGRLPPPYRLRFEQHLMICPGCSTYVEQMRDTIALVGALREEDVPRPAQEALLRAFSDWKRN